MSVAIEKMIAALEPPRSAPGIFAARHSGLSKTVSKQRVRCAVSDYSFVDSGFSLVEENLSKALDLRTGESVLEIAGGNEGAQLAETDEVPFESDSFDVVTSVFSMMFAADHERAAQGLLRVCRPGGRIGLACWSTDGFMSQLISTIRRYVPSGSGLNARVLWGTRTYLDALFGDHADALGAETRSHAWHYRSSQQWLDSWCSKDGPLQKAYDCVDPDRRQQLSAEILELIGRYNEASDGTVVVRSEYLEFVVHKSTWRTS
jgi:SAM-dependent methyltransferase